MKYLVLLFTLLITHLSIAQIGVGPIELVRLKSGKFDKEAIEMLKKTETIFVCSNTDDASILEETLKEVWTITKLSVVPESDLGSLEKGNYSYFSTKGYSVNVTTPGINYSNSHTYLSLVLPYTNKKGKGERHHYCRIELFPASGGDSKFKNWQPGFLRTYLKIVNDHLKDGEERWLFKSESTGKELRKFRRATLYIPETIFAKTNKFTGKEEDTWTKEELLGKYPYKYEIISAEALSQKILESEEPIYYLSYVKSSTDKYVSVYSSAGKLIYNQYSGAKYNIKKGDFTLLAKKIEVAK